MLLMQKKTGFTIVELIVAIAVISLLATISLVSYSEIRSRAVNVSVLSEMKQISNNLLRFHVMNGRYPKRQAEISSVVTIKTGGIYATHPNTFSYCYNGDTGQVGLGAVSSAGRGYVIKGGGVVEVTGWSHTLMEALCPNVFGVPVIGTSDITFGWMTPSSNPPTWGGQYLAPL